MSEAIREYINNVMGGIKCSSKYKRQIEEELSSHIEELYADYLNEGYDINKIEKMVINSMGDPGDIRNNFNYIIWLKTKKKIAKGIFGLTAVFALVLGINSTVINMTEQKNYTTFLNGIEEGNVSVADTLLNELYSPNYKNNSLLTGAIETYCELVENHHRFQLIVTKNLLIASEEGKYEEIR